MHAIYELQLFYLVLSIGISNNQHKENYGSEQLSIIYEINVKVTVRKVRSTM
jgi:hypothetical protein